MIDAAKRDWLATVIGVTLPPAAQPGGGVRATPVDPGIAPPGGAPGPAWQDRPGTGDAIRSSGPDTAPRQMHGAKGRMLGIAVGSDGRVALSAPPPPVAEITFAGGGGKGAALPGAVRALHASGVLKDVKVINGASVGSMTAAMVAAGCTADEFASFANDPALAGQIMEGKNMAEVMFGGGLTGDGLETLLRAKLDATIQKQAMSYVNACINGKTKPDEGVIAVLERLADGTKGPTFGDMRALSKVIPDIKEVSISATMMAEVDPVTGEAAKGGKPQLAMFNADTEPDMEVALAVRASASLPPVFKPVDITLSSGITARFEDGGVLNNVPNSDSLGTERDLDPVPTKGSMSFVFENDDANAAARGEATPNRSRISDWISQAPNSAANYATYRELADHPEDMVIVPLRITLPPKKGKKDGEAKDFSGLLKGTLNFNMEQDARTVLQEKSAEATAAYMKKRQEPKTRQFASMEQMLLSIGHDDLVALVADKLEGAAEALAFRDAVTTTIVGLAILLSGKSDAKGAEIAYDHTVQEALAELDALAGSDKERQLFVGRELNRDPKLDRLIDAARDAGGNTGVLVASFAVDDALTAQAHARTILREVLYPRIVTEDPTGPSGLVLKQADDRLRAVTSPADVNTALKTVIEHYRKKRDPLGVKGCKKFADALAKYLMKTS